MIETVTVHNFLLAMVELNRSKYREFIQLLLG